MVCQNSQSRRVKLLENREENVDFFSFRLSFSTFVWENNRPKQLRLCWKHQARQSVFFLYRQTSWFLYWVHVLSYRWSFSL